MLVLETCPAAARKHRQSAGGRRRPQEVRPAYRTRLRIEPLEDRRLLSVFTVTNLSDAPVANPGDLPGSLRQAIYDADHTPGADTIQFASGLSGTIDLTAGELPVTGVLSIQGPGAATLTIDAQNNSRIFDVNDGNSAKNVAVEIQGLTLTGGNASGSTFPVSYGGAIFSYENLTVRNCVISGNHADSSGGGIFVNSDNGGTTTIQNSTISGNTAASGGGIVASTSYYGAVTIEDSTISGNAATSGQGGGVIASANPYGAVTLQNCTVTGNTATGDAGGIGVQSYYGSTVNIRNSTITGNTADSTAGGSGSGGGLNVLNGAGAVAVTSCIIAANVDNSGTAPDLAGARRSPIVSSATIRAPAWPKCPSEPPIPAATTTSSAGPSAT